jgi:hypothetical protein
MHTVEWLEADVVLPSLLLLLPLSGAYSGGI